MSLNAPAANCAVSKQSWPAPIRACTPSSAFSSRAGVHEVPSEMPRADRAAPWPFRLLARLRPGRPALRGRNVDGQADDWCAENRNEP